MTVIAMTREMGTLGKDVAAGVAEALGIEVVHQELVEHHLAERLHLSESEVHRFLEGNARLWERWKISPEHLSHYTADEVLRLARGGNVLIRGWGAAQLLRDISHVMRVRICAPMAKRVEVMKERLGSDDEAAIRREIIRSDDAHSRTVQRQFGFDWRDADGYDIVLNTGSLSVETCITLLRELAGHSAYKETEASRRALGDKLIEADIHRVLDAHAADTMYGSGLDVTVDGGKVRLSGVVLGYQGLATALEEIKRIDGVGEVENAVTFVPYRGEV